MVSGKWAEREKELAQFSYELSLGGVADIALRAMAELHKERPSRWRLIRRWSWLLRYHLLLQLATAAEAEEREQREASA